MRILRCATQLTAIKPIAAYEHEIRRYSGVVAVVQQFTLYGLTRPLRTVPGWPLPPRNFDDPERAVARVSHSTVRSPVSSEKIRHLKYRCQCSVRESNTIPVCLVHDDAFCSIRVQIWEPNSILKALTALRGCGLASEKSGSCATAYYSPICGVYIPRALAPRASLLLFTGWPDS